jgi:hypothetical protein
MGGVTSSTFYKRVTINEEDESDYMMALDKQIFEDFIINLTKEGINFVEIVSQLKVSPGYQRAIRKAKRVYAKDLKKGVIYLIIYYISHVHLLAVNSTHDSIISKINKILKADCKIQPTHQVSVP